MYLIIEIKIIFKNISTAQIKKEGISQEGMETAEDYGDYLVRNNYISKLEYDEKIDLYKYQSFYCRDNRFDTYINLFNDYPDKLIIPW